MDGQTLGICPSAIEDESHALGVYSLTLGTCFAPYLPESLEVALPSLQFCFYDGLLKARPTYVRLVSLRFLPIVELSSPRLTPKLFGIPVEH